MTDTPGQRVYAIRLALGDGWKNALPMADFAALLGTKAGRNYDSAMVSRMESGERNLSLADVTALALVDPLRRGRLWLAWGEQADSTMEELPRVQNGPDEPTAEDRAAFVNAELAAAKAEREKGAASKAAGGTPGRARRR